MAAQDARKRTEPRDHLLHKRQLAIVYAKWQETIHAGSPLMSLHVGRTGWYSVSWDQGHDLQTAIVYLLCSPCSNDVDICLPIVEKRCICLLRV